MSEIEPIRPMATIQRIKELNPISGADRIEAATILGWRVVVKKGEFTANDLVCFFEVGSVIPFNPWNSFLAKAGETPQTIRLRTVKMKGQISQGLALPIGQIPKLAGLEISEGSNVTEVLGVTKYEPPCVSAGNLEARGLRPHWVFKTDEPRVQGIPWIIDYMKGKSVYVTQKLDGSSCSVGSHPTDGAVVCSRNISLKLEAENRFTKVANPLLKRIPNGFVVQGEMVGPGIQDNRLGLGSLDFYAFNVWNLNEPGFTGLGELLGLDAFLRFCDEIGIKTVPLLHVGEFEWSDIESLLKFANCRTYQNGHPQEGIVIRPQAPEWHEKIGMLSFKAINNEFLLKVGE